MKRLGVYIQDFVEITTRLKMLAGLRYSVSAIETPDSIYATGNTKMNSQSRKDDAFSPRLGIVFQPTKNISVFGSYTNTYELNTAIDTFGKVLPPSIIDQYELGIKMLLFHKMVSINTTAYLVSNNNAVQSYPSLSPGDSRRENGGQTQSKGVELDIETKTIQGFSMHGGYSYNDTRYTKSTLYVPGSKLRYNPSHTANAHIYYSVKPGTGLQGLNAGFGIYYMGERVAGRSATKANPGYALMPVPAYLLLDAGIGYTYQHLDLRLKINNILNRLSYNVHDDNSVNPIAPRQFTGTISYTF
jgi:iron complex outermembrane receptor protein